MSKESHVSTFSLFLVSEIGRGGDSAGPTKGFKFSHVFTVVFVVRIIGVDIIALSDCC